MVVGDHATLADLEATLFHETLDRAGVRRMPGPEFVVKLKKLLVRLGGTGGKLLAVMRRGDEAEGEQMVTDRALVSGPSRA